MQLRLRRRRQDFRLVGYPIAFPEKRVRLAIDAILKSYGALEKVGKSTVNVVSS
jgi:hypothetical protein